MPSEEGLSDPFKLLGFDCANMILSYLTPTEVVRCSLVNDALRQWSHLFMSVDGLRQSFRHYTETSSPDNNNTLLPVEYSTPASYRAFARRIDLNADGYLVVQYVLKQTSPVMSQFIRDAVFHLEEGKEMWHRDHEVNGSPELDPLYIGKNRVYYVTRFATETKLVAYDVKTGEQLYQSGLPEVGPFTPQFHFIFDRENEYLASRVVDYKSFRPSLCIILIGGANGQVAQMIEVQRGLSEFRGMLDSAAFTLRGCYRELPSIQLLIKYKLQPNGLFTRVSIDVLALPEDESEDSNYYSLTVDTFRLLGFAIIDTEFSDSLIRPLVLNLEELSDTSIRNGIEKALSEEGFHEEIGNWFTVAGQVYNFAIGNCWVKTKESVYNA
ncbi:hypothetical protein AJ79_05477 [Helicocarpus griseus UAMH5409]|uniref:F-box domain-containing protein n=1 Tax=Helicocarpus griseus UAMH5409 TaxID=1447875 RepID=A0A2B7XNJ1_9EURO|nr:hypothetical protein AJ79_05477 [Helicocarpus griseus UAMH5409]